MWTVLLCTHQTCPSVTTSVPKPLESIIEQPDVYDSNNNLINSLCADRHKAGGKSQTANMADNAVRRPGRLTHQTNFSNRRLEGNKSRRNFVLIRDVRCRAGP